MRITIRVDGIPEFLGPQIEALVQRQCEEWKSWIRNGRLVEYVAPSNHADARNDRWMQVGVHGG